MCVLCESTHKLSVYNMCVRLFAFFSLAGHYLCIACLSLYWMNLCVCSKAEKQMCNVHKYINADRWAVRSACQPRHLFEWAHRKRNNVERERERQRDDIEKTTAFCTRILPQIWIWPSDVGRQSEPERNNECVWYYRSLCVHSSIDACWVSTLLLFCSYILCKFFSFMLKRMRISVK